MAVSRTNANAAATLLFLAKLRDILTTYFGELEEESLRDNFVIAYELLDEARALPRSTADAVGYAALQASAYLAYTEESVCAQGLAGCCRF